VIDVSPPPGSSHGRARGYVVRTTITGKGFYLRGLMEVRSRSVPVWSTRSTGAAVFTRAQDAATTITKHLPRPTEAVVLPVMKARGRDGR
jgi:hypothetical protein